MFIGEIQSLKEEDGIVFTMERGPSGKGLPGQYTLKGRGDTRRERQSESTKL